MLTCTNAVDNDIPGVCADMNAMDTLARTAILLPVEPPPTPQGRTSQLVTTGTFHI